MEVSPGSCDYGSYFWGNNNVCQRNLSYAQLDAHSALIELPFVIGSAYSHAKFVEIIVHKGRKLADVPMRLIPLPPRKGEEPPMPVTDHVIGAKSSGEQWELIHRVAGIGFEVKRAKTHRMKLSFKLPRGFDLDRPTRLTVYQRNDFHVITGSAILEIRPRHWKNDDRL